MKQAEAFLPTLFGNFKIVAYADSPEELMPNIALVHEDFDHRTDVTVRVHSECMTGDVFGSKKCDCGEQLNTSLAMIAEQKGVLIYLRQEGRGIGLINKLKAYQLQEKGLNTIEANTHLGFEADARQYAAAVEILRDLGIKKMKLITNNPLKISILEKSDFEITERIDLHILPQEENYKYFETKKVFMGHLLNLE
jgi:GTP cyclohydrolase II